MKNQLKNEEHEVKELARIHFFQNCKWHTKISDAIIEFGSHSSLLEPFQ
jgi:hypothetical protein